jgi:hypothetical protein
MKVIRSARVILSALTSANEKPERGGACYRLMQLNVNRIPMHRNLSANRYSPFIASEIRFDAAFKSERFKQFHSVTMENRFFVRGVSHGTGDLAGEFVIEVFCHE